MLLPLDSTPVPAATEHEARLLACFCLDSINGNKAGCLRKAQALGVGVESFYKPMHILVWEACLALSESNHLLDDLGIHCWIRDNRKDEETLTVQDIAAIIDTCETTVWFEHWLTVVLETHAKREFRQMGMKVAEMASGGASASDMGNVMENKPKGLVAATASVRLDATAKEATARLIEMHRLKRGFIGLATGIGALDAILSGIRPSTVNVIAGRPGQGKTSIGLQIALNLISANIRVRFWSLEMTPVQLHNKLALNHSGTNWQFAKDGLLKPEQLQSYERSADAVARMPLDICKSTSVTTTEIAGTLYKDLALNAPGSQPQLVIIDYFQLIQPSDKRVRREEQLESISRELKALALDTNVPILLLAQLNRENVKDKRRPRAADLRGSGALEQDADTITLLHHPDDMHDHELMLIVDKNREDRTGDCTVSFNKPFSRIYDIPGR